jgi:light-regulated signal transduction histidine kinase (bacteriophytochrome)
MNQPPKAFDHQGLKFFGKINASISHEIKNVLSIINENAGLLEDFTRMADKGLPIDPERLKTLAGMIQKQVKRADGIVKNMNTFAHSVDETVKTVDLGETLVFVSTLTARLVANRGITLETVPSDEPVMLNTNPFRLINLIWLCVDFAMDWTGNMETITIFPENTPAGITIKLSGLEGLTSAAPNKIAPDEKLQDLSDALGVKMTISADTGSLALVFPETNEKQI